MKRRKLFTLSIAAVVFLLCGLLSVAAFSPMDKLSEKYEGDTITEMAKTSGQWITRKSAMSSIWPLQSPLMKHP